MRRTGTGEDGVGVDAVARYLKEIGRRPLLDAAGERRLGALVRAGHEAEAALASDPPPAPAERGALEAARLAGQAAAAEFVEANLRLVVATARPYRSTRVPFLDLVQEGNVGLLQAVETFDPGRGVRFSTYATWCIRRAIVRGLHEGTRAIRVPDAVLRSLTELGRTTDELMSRLSRPPTVEELSEALGCSDGEVATLRSLPGEPASLDAPAGEDADLDRYQVLVDPAAADPATEVAEAELAGALHGMISALDDQERAVLVLRYGLRGAQPCGWAAIAERLATSRVEVRRIERRALRHLRQEAHLTPPLAS